MKTFIYFVLIFSLIIPPNVADALAPESVQFESAVRGDRHTAELLSSLFKWANKQKESASLDALKVWFRKKNLEPVQIDEMLVVPAYNSILIIYPADKNEIGTMLHNSGYRVLWIPKCVDIESREDIEAIFNHIDNIRMAERILEGLPKKEYKGKDALVLNPAVFFWAQNILQSRFGDTAKRYELERKLLFSVLFRQYPDLDEKIKKQLEKFSSKCMRLGNGYDLVEADRFILSAEIYENSRFPEVVKALAERAEVIYREICETEAERNSVVDFYSSLRAIARVMPEFEPEKEFSVPEKRAGRLISYIVEEYGDINLFYILSELEIELVRYQYARIKGLNGVLGAIRKALQRKDTSATLEDLRKGSLGSVLIEFFRRIPKADLHHHLDGSISPELAFKVLQKYPELMGLYGNPKTADDLKKYIEFSYRGEGEINWNDLWTKFAFFKDVVNTGIEAVRFVFRESSLEDFNNDGLTVIEQKVSITTPGQNPDVDPAAVLTAAVKGLIEAENATSGKLRTGLIPCIWKTPPQILNRRYDDVVRMAGEDTRDLDKVKQDILGEISGVEHGEFNEMLIELKRQVNRQKTEDRRQRAEEIKKRLIILYEAREEALEQVKMVVDLKKKWEGENPKYAQYIIGIDTVGDEKDYIRWVNAPALRYAAGNGLRITEHLGENWHPGELKYALLRIKQGIESGIVKRIGHATVLGINPDKFRGKCADEEITKIRKLQREIKRLIKEKGIHIETCPSSNKLLVPERDMGLIATYYDHPVVRFFLELGDVSINTDDSWILHTRGLSGEFMKIWLANPELTFNDIQKIINNSFDASFIDKGMKGMGSNDRVTRVLTKGEKVDIIKVLRDNLSIKNKGLILDLPEDLPLVFVPSSEHDALMVFFCMLSNSINAGSKKIKITVGIVNNVLKIIVEDDGSGIQEAHLKTPEGSSRPWIFIAGNTTRRDEPGEHGLGLSYVWDTVVGKWKGKISVTSTVGKGTKFVLEVPIIDEGQQRSHPQRVVPDPDSAVDVCA